MSTGLELMEHVVSKFINRNDTVVKVNFWDVDLIMYRISALLDQSNMAIVMKFDLRNILKINKTMYISIAGGGMYMCGIKHQN